MGFLLFHLGQHHCGAAGQIQLNADLVPHLFGFVALMGDPSEAAVAEIVGGHHHLVGAFLRHGHEQHESLAGDAAGRRRPAHQ